MSQYGEYNYDDGVRFQSSYENAYTKKVEQPNDSVPFNKMYFDNGIDLPTALQSKLPNKAVVYGDFKIKEKSPSGLTNLTITAKSWNSVSVMDGANERVFAPTATNRVGTLTVAFSNSDAQHSYKVKVAFCGKESEAKTVGASGTNTINLQNVDLTSYLLDQTNVVTFEFTCTETVVE